MVKKTCSQIRIGLYCLTLTIFKLELNDKLWPAIIHYVAKIPDSKSINGGIFKSHRYVHVIHQEYVAKKCLIDAQTLDFL